MKNIVLTGFMATGKTVVGKELSKRLSKEFIDVDVLVEKKAGKPIRGIFAEWGESRFRQLESQTIAELSYLSDKIIATGGGAIVNPENLNNLKKNGIVICLHSEPEILLKRIRDFKSRPMFEGAKTYQERLERAQKLLELRAPHYGKADFHIDTSMIDINKTTEKILNLMKLVNRCQVVEVNLGERSYKIFISPGLLQETANLLSYYPLSKKVLIITNPRILSLYGEKLEAALKENFQTFLVTVPEGERYKSLKWANKLYHFLVDLRLERGSTVIALGGGVIGDLAGFVAATYMRGINLVQVPTSLLAQVDSSVGGKVAVNHPKGKNLIGAFYQPKVVIIDPETLFTLPKRELRAGLAEVIKYGIITDSNFFAYLEETLCRILSLDMDSLTYVIKRCCEIKARIVEEDEREAGLRRILNYGHTIGHAIETVTNYRKYRHGEAISIGMAVAGSVAQKMGIFKEEDLRRQNALLASAGLPVAADKLDVQALIDSLKVDKKVKEGKVRFVLPQEIGKVIVSDQVPLKLIKETLTQV